MQYFGGKHFTADKITDKLMMMMKRSQVYLEPFVGAAWVVSKMKAKTRLASDSNPYLIAMYQALQNGWLPPDEISEELYAELRKGTGKQKQDGPQVSLKESKHPLELIGFAGHACSFAGIWYGSYARDPASKKQAGQTGTNFCEKGKNSMMKLLPHIRTVKFYCKSYLDWHPKNAFVYCDPPYAATHQPYFSQQFDSDLFWDTMREWSKTNTVVISEYDAPDDFKCITEILTKTRVECTIKDSARVEKLFSLTEYNPFEGIF